MRLADFPGALGETEGDGNGVGDSQGDDAYGDESGERATAAEVDQTEEHLDDCQEEGVDGDAETGMNVGPEAREWDCVVARERPGRAGCGNGDADRAEEGDYQDEEGEGETAAGGAHYVVEDEGKGLTGGGVEDRFQGREGDADREDKQEAREAADGDAEADRLRDFDG